MLPPRTLLAVHIAASAIVYQFGGSFSSALLAVNPDKLNAAWYEAADYVIRLVNSPNTGLLPPSIS